MKEYSKAYNIYYNLIMNYKVLPNNIIKKYLKGYKKHKDKHCLDVIVMNNQRYIALIAYKRLENNFDILDLINEGNIGLIKAINTFDINKENTFLSYASYKIEKEIRTFIDKYSTFTHIPYNIIINNNIMKNYIEDFIKKNNYEPSLINIAENTRLNINKINNCINYTNNKALKKQNNEFDENEHILPNELFDNKQAINAIFFYISEEEKNILTDYYGLSNNIELSKCQISEKYNIQEEKILLKINEIIKKIKTKLNFETF